MPVPPDFSLPDRADASCGERHVLRLAQIDESRCIGCTLCIAACPVDAIIGAPKRMHTVLAAWCTGCELCVAPCPVDCIDLVAAGRAWSTTDAQAARQRHERRSRRESPTMGEHGLPEDARDHESDRVTTNLILDLESRRRAVAAAIGRARARRNQGPR